MSHDSASPKKPDWSRARGLHSELLSSVRRSLAAQVLIGKELKALKIREGIVRGKNQWVERPSPTWEARCREELGITSKTGDRWIDLFDAALERAKQHKKTEPEALRLLLIPADELDGNELDALAACVDRLVENDTQAGLLEELGIVKAPGLRPGGPSPVKSGGDLTLEFVSNFFRHGFNTTAEVLKKADRFIGDCDFDAYLNQLPLVGFEAEDGGAPVIGLQEFKAALEDLHAKFHEAEQRLQATVKKTEAAIEASMISVGPKSRPRKSPAKEETR